MEGHKHISTQFSALLLLSPEDNPALGQGQSRKGKGAASRPAGLRGLPLQMCKITGLSRMG